MAKEHWLKLRDKNTKYFHACVKQRRQVNKIYGISDEGEVFCSHPAEVEKAFLVYFQCIFSTSNLVGMS
jgi:hypothetical protein